MHWNTVANTVPFRCKKQSPESFLPTYSSQGHWHVDPANVAGRHRGYESSNPPKTQPAESRTQPHKTPNHPKAVLSKFRPKRPKLPLRDLLQSCRLLLRRPQVRYGTNIVIFSYASRCRLRRSPLAAMFTRGRFSFNSIWWFCDKVHCVAPRASPWFWDRV